MAETLLLVTGMFRSGTTLAARMLHAHKEIVLASDPFARVFKAFRNIAASTQMVRYGIPSDAPLGDYFFYPDQREVCDAVQKSDFSLPTNTLDLRSLRQSVEQASRQFSPLIKPHLGALKGNDFFELFESCYQIIQSAYGKPNARVLGTKEVWVGEFGSHFLRGCKDSKVIHIIRDPRAVCASNFVTSEKYPLLFLIRQWRKMAYFAWRDHQKSPDRVLIVRYEDLVVHPLQTLNKISSFLGVGNDDDTLNPMRYVDGQGRPWRQNSSHFNGGQLFNTKSVDAWRSALNSFQIRLIEQLCQGEMKLFKYSDSGDRYCPLSLDFVLHPCLYESSELSEWIRPFTNSDVNYNIREMGIEHLRNHQLISKEAMSEEQVNALFFNVEFFDRMRSI